jgi:ubiquinone/menaquinone biosynthesis C-methylase UbiE
VSQANSEQQQFWDRRAPAWERRADSLDSIADSYGRPVMEALGLDSGQRVVDIGCGPGSTAIELARRIGNRGEVVGVDISAGMVAAAGRRAAAAGLTNVRFLVADAQTDLLGQDFDAAFSRFGVMFFGDPVAAFANIGRSLKKGGRLACAVWGPLADNPWMFVPTLAAVQVLNAELTLPEPGRPGPFSLDLADRIHEVLSAAGFVDTAVERIEGYRHITSETAGDNVTTLLAVGPLGEAYEAAAERTRELAAEAVVSALEPYHQNDGWDLPGVALKVTARRG